MATGIQAFRPPHTKLGECPLYREEDNTLHYIDMLGYSIHVLTLAEPYQARVIRCPELISFMSFCHGGGYLVCYFQGIARVGDDGEWQVLKKIIPDEDKSAIRLNDGAIDSQGRLWVGTIDLGLVAQAHVPDDQRPRGAVYRYDPDGTLTVHEPGKIICGNGIGWTPDDQTALFTDSYRKIIWAYDFDSATGTISNKRIFIDRRGQDGEPDGLVLDTAGNVYTFLWKGSHVVKYDSRGTFVRDWKINASRVTHGAWVGKNFDELVVTSAEADEGSTPWEGEEGGALFWIKDLGCAGMRKHKFGKAE